MHGPFEVSVKSMTSFAGGFRKTKRDMIDEAEPDLFVYRISFTISYTIPSNKLFR